MKEKKIINGKKSGEMTGQSAAPDCIPEDVACGAVYETFWAVANRMYRVRGPTLI